LFNGLWPVHQDVHADLRFVLRGTLAQSSALRGREAPDSSIESIAGESRPARRYRHGSVKP